MDALETSNSSLEGKVTDLVAASSNVNDKLSALEQATEQSSSTGKKLSDDVAKLAKGQAALSDDLTQKLQLVETTAAEAASQQQNKLDGMELQLQETTSLVQEEATK